jgi:hypothetical protein
MILCELPEERAQARERYFQKKTSDLDSFIDNALNKVERAGGVPIERNRETSVSRGPGRVAED